MLLNSNILQTLGNNFNIINALVDYILLRERDLINQFLNEFLISKSELSQWVND